MKKLELQRFRELKQELIERFNKEYNSEEETQKAIERYIEIREILEKHDLSDIEFEEWTGMFLGGIKEYPLDFSKTKANLDFSIIEYMLDKNSCNFKGCNIRNFDFDKTAYSPKMFDEKFIKENKSFFLNEDVPQDISEAYYTRSLTLEKFSDNMKYFEGKKITHAFPTWPIHEHKLWIH